MTSPAKDALTEAIKAVDAEIGERGPDEILTHYVVVASWTKVGDVGVDDSTQITGIPGPDAMAVWQMIGLLRTAADHEQFLYDHEADDD